MAMSIPVALGTSIMAVTFNGGVILGADSRTSTGNYVANRVTDKITPLCDNVYVLRSGSAGDTQAIAGYVQHFISQFQAEEGERITVKTAANLVKTIAYNNKDNLEAGMIVAGFDKHGGGQVFSISLGGTLQQAPFAMSGSGSSYITGFVDKNWRDNMSEQEAMDFVMRSLKYAMTWDASSGGCIRTVTITEAGVDRRFTQGSQIPPTYGELGRDKILA
ncbi:Proteasome subunit beta type-6 [Tetrabaena socialis]|uniref:Proteasome subunit beta n=1 Tax=Tetrabaena socialis TaxID=47790 RepID=A0A2J8A156_9CHLO|nr:Proteasome subunit beta type-6 [Tetrabaena socialis]|eukprot:PNH06257.1 Proteasome subunit beta type-6 [Tetrabaena socialis]